MRGRGTVQVNGQFGYTAGADTSGTITLTRAASFFASFVITPDSNGGAAANRPGKPRKCLNAGQPDLIPLEKRLPNFTGGVEHFFFGLFYKAEEVRKENNARRIRIRPVCLKSHLKHDAGF